MLFELYIKDFILIEETRIPFHNGFNVMTGETGAGKSMVIGALNLILGAQASKDMVRIDADVAHIKASFETDAETQARLSDMGIGIDPEIVTLAREIQSKGKSIARINGQVCTIAQLKQVAEGLLDIHGQMDNQVLLNQDAQLAYLDGYCGRAHLENIAAMKQQYQLIKKTEAEIEALKTQIAERAREEDFMRFQLDEIDAAKLQPDEDVAIEQEFERLNRSDQMMGSLEKLTTWLSGEYGEGVVSTASSLGAEFSKLGAFDSHMADYGERLKDVFYILDDLNKDVSAYREQVDLNPERLGVVQMRLDEINRLKSKYGKTVEAILAYREELESALEQMDGADAHLDKLEAQQRDLMATYDAFAKDVSARRREMAQSFESALMVELKELNMKEAVFKLAFEAVDFSPLGYEHVAFTIATNAGQPLKPMKKVVSGGELSRIMLAIKVIVGGDDAVSTLVFDEIDAGISGHTANVVGEKLARLSAKSQVISITHLPQIAVYGDAHLWIVKFEKNGVTTTDIKWISGEEVTDEIVRLVGGKSPTEATLTHAAQMLEHARTIKSKCRQ